NIDMTPPEITLAQPENPADLIFSPDKDGNKDSLLIRITGSLEDSWKAVITDASGETVKTFTLDNQAPKDLTWDGRNNADILVPDGVYFFSMAATDRAKNSTSAELQNIIINTQRPQISLTIDNQYFSPNDGSGSGDGIKDAVTVTQQVPVREGIVSWELKVNDGTGTARRTYNNSVLGAIPAAISFDGRDDGGNPLPEGTYRGILTLLYENGYNPTAETPDFYIDVTLPSGSVRADYTIFSPNGDGNKDIVTFAQDSSREDVWESLIQDVKGNIVKRYYWPDRADATVTWDGRRDDKTAVPDGEYTYVLYTTDRAGNRGESSPVNVEVSTKTTPVALASDFEAFSPNGAGVQDTLPLKPDLKVGDGVERYSLTVLSADGKPVRQVTGRKAPDPVYQWDGTGESGIKVPDGNYYAVLDVVYSNGNNPTARTPVFSVDREAPQANIAADFAVFSPNGDGSKDQVTIQVQDASQEDQWSGTIRDRNGSSVLDYSWAGKPDNTIVWDGKGKDGRIVPDGTYDFELYTKDKAGNSGRSQIARFTIDTEETPILLSAEQDAFSPNGDGVKDILVLIPQMKIAAGVESYILSIRNAARAEVRQFAGKNRVEDVFNWNGATQAGVKVPDGPYTADITVTYVNGNVSTAKTQPFILDTLAPTAQVSSDLAVFSPNNDGRKDAVTFTQQGSAEELWTGRVVNAAGEAVKKYSWKNTPDKNLVWNGINDSNALVPDGLYSYRLESVDRAGNTGRSGILSLELVTIETPIRLAADQEAFSPNSDGKKDQLKFTPQISVQKGIESYTLRVMNASGGVVRTFSGTQPVPASITWDGATDSKAKAPDGMYTAALAVQYVQGNLPETATNPFTLDTVFPEISASADYALFSPNDDGKKDAVAITQRSSREDLWEGFIRDAKGVEIRRYLWKNLAESFSWNGTDASGNKVKDDAYTYTVQSTDAAGNETKRTVGPLQSDTRYTSAYITANKTGFAPKGTGPESSIAFSIYTALRDGINSWAVSMVDEAGRIQKQFTGTGAVPSSLTWDGRNDKGTVTESAYTAQIKVVYNKGDEPEAKTIPFMVDMSPPEARLTLNPVPFSPDNDGVDDELSINLNLSDLSGIRDWTLAVNDPAGSAFITFSGRGKPADRILWNGISSTGELVQAAVDYPYTLTATDILGNTAVTKGQIPVDVLVIRDGERLKIRISSINFEPYKANLILDASETGQKNQRILGRLAEILTKYRTYKIRVEGHAVSEYWDIPARAEREEKEELQPLSKARADAVRDYLVKLGIEASRLSTAGLGGTQPVVPHGDLVNRWKSRRVEFILIKP
ncbi:MAG: hypothetical protein E4H36_05345, partial [Spirochaetales bacterium]